MPTTESADQDQQRTSDSGGTATLRRMLGPISVACVGVGGAIGSGIFATPGEAAKYLHAPWLILSVWVLAGFITLLQSFVTAELATRFPRAGGEYQYLKEAYGNFAAFFFGWSFTIFIVGGGGGTIAAAFGEFVAELFVMDQPWAQPAFGCCAILAVTVINALGLRTGAVTLNVLTLLKTAALLAIAVGVVVVAGRLTPVAPREAVQTVDHARPFVEAYLLALMPAFWAYTGATDSAKLAEETRDVKRALPLALIMTVAILTTVYCLYNYALLCAVSPQEMAGQRSVPALIFRRVNGYPVNDLVLIASALICLGAISSVFLANVRVTYALARDGLTFRFLGKMSGRQAPVASIAVGGALACAFVLNRRFGEILKIYFLASAVLFGLTYLSLIGFRLRDRRAGSGWPTGVFKTPAGYLVAIVLIAIEFAIAAGIVTSDIREGSRDSLWTAGLLAALALLYAVWRKFLPSSNGGDTRVPNATATHKMQ